MKNTLITILSNDTSYNKSASRYLYKSYPEIWNNILQATSFLPSNAKPKQRIWHIINDVYNIPLCPITSMPVKWHENQYLETYSVAAKIELCKQTGRYRNTPSEERQARRTESIRKGFASGRIKPFIWTPELAAARYAKITAATFNKYGVTSTLLLPDIRAKQIQTKINKGLITPVSSRTDRDIYYAVVARFTRISWIANFDQINPTRLNRSYYNLDHIFSVHQGFIHNIPPYIIGHWTNLRMLDANLNSSKGSQCDKTANQLFEDFFSNTFIG